MPLSINTNVASLTAQRAMLNSNAGLETAFERLSTGKRINSASDAVSYTHLTLPTILLV